MKVAHSSTTSTDTPRIPTARAAAGTMTDTQVTNALRDSWRDDTNRVPMFDDAWGRPSAWAAFGDGAA